MPGTNLGSKMNSILRLEDYSIVVTQEEESVANPSQIPDPNKWSERSPTPDFVEEVMFDSSSDEMPTCLKYSRF